MGQGLIVAILSILLYLSNLLGGGTGQSLQPQNPPTEQQAYYVIGQTGNILADITIRRIPHGEGTPVATVKEGQAVIILDKNEGWYKIRLSSGLEGWVPEYSVTISQPAQRSIEKVVLGYYPGDESAYESLLEHGSQLTSVAPLGWQLNSYGELQADFDPEKMGRSLYFAGNQELETYGQIKILANPSRLLANTHLQEESIARIMDTTENWGLKGVLLDLNYVPGAEQTQLGPFIDKLATTLKERELKSFLALPWDENLDYASVADSVDYLILKGGADTNALQPGPLQDVAQLKSMLESTVQQVTPEKIILAVSTAGFDWPRSGLPTPLTHDEVLQLAATEGATIKWDAQAQAPYFHYGSGHVVWFENRYSIKYKVDLIRSQKIAGIALQNLGQEDPEIWPILEKNL